MHAIMPIYVEHGALGSLPRQTRYWTGTRAAELRNLLWKVDASSDRGRYKRCWKQIAASSSARKAGTGSLGLVSWGRYQSMRVSACSFRILPWPARCSGRALPTTLHFLNLLTYEPYSCCSRCAIQYSHPDCISFVQFTSL